MMICGMDIGYQSSLNMLENRWGAIFESERGLAWFLRLEAAQLDDFGFQLNEGGGGENYPSLKITRLLAKTQETESKRSKATKCKLYEELSSITGIEVRSDVANFGES